MRTRNSYLLLASAAALLIGTGAQAATLTTSNADWSANVGASANNTTVLGDEFTTPSSISLSGGGSFTAANFNDVPNDIRTIGSGWGSWSGTYSGQVLYNEASAATLSLSGLAAFGFEVEPNHDGPFDFTIALSSGESTTLAVAGNAGAQFFGFYGGGVTSLSITSQDTDFAYGNFVSVSAVPLPASAPMFGLALVALAALGYGANRSSMRKAPDLA